MTIAFFGGLLTFLSAFLAPFRAHLDAKANREYGEGGPALLHAAKLTAEAASSCVGIIVWPLLALIGITALRVFLYWPQFDVLQAVAPLLELLWWLTLAGWVAAIAMNSRKISNYAQKRNLFATTGRHARLQAGRRRRSCCARSEVARTAGAASRRSGISRRRIRLELDRLSEELRRVRPVGQRQNGVRSQCAGRRPLGVRLR